MAFCEFGELGDVGGRWDRLWQIHAGAAIHLGGASRKRELGFISSSKKTTSNQSLQLFQELFIVLFILWWLRCPCRLGMPWSEHCSDATATDFSLGTRLFGHGHHGPLKSNMQLLKYPFWRNFYAKFHDIHASRTSQRIELAERCLLSKPEASPPRPCPWLQGWPRRLGYGCVFAMLYKEPDGICTKEQSDFFQAFTQSWESRRVLSKANLNNPTRRPCPGAWRKGRWCGSATRCAVAGSDGRFGLQPDLNILNFYMSFFFCKKWVHHIFECVVKGSRLIPEVWQLESCSLSVVSVVFVFATVCNHPQPFAARPQSVSKLRLWAVLKKCLSDDVQNSVLTLGFATCVEVAFMAGAILDKRVDVIGSAFFGGRRSTLSRCIV